MLTPGVTGLIDTCGTAGDTDLLYIAPKFFDSLPDGQPLYQQLTWLRGDGDMPFLHLDTGQAGLLRQTLALIARLPQSVRTCRESMLRHLCGVLLLQITDLVSRTNGKGPVSVKHADEIFRSFKRLLVGHYRACHTIGFYARQLHISETYLARIVRRTTGRTVRDQIAELLCADAKKLLECTDLRHQGDRRHAGILGPVGFREVLPAADGSLPLGIPRGERGVRTAGAQADSLPGRRRAAIRLRKTTAGGDPFGIPPAA